MYHCLLSDLWLRLYAHALLCESRIFPNIELCDEPPDYVPEGFTDIWKGRYHGEPVCIKVVRTQNPIRLREIKRVRDSLILLVVHLARSIQDLQSSNQRGQAHLPSEHTSNHRGIRHAVSTFCSDPVDAGWEHQPVHRNPPRSQPVDTGRC